MVESLYANFFKVKKLLKFKDPTVYAYSRLMEREILKNRFIISYGAGNGTHRDLSALSIYEYQERR